MKEKLKLGAFIALGLILLLLVLMLMACAPEQPVARSYSCAVYTEQGCAKFVVASGGEIEVQSGGTIDFQTGFTISDGDAVIADDLRISAQSSITVTNGAAFTPTGTYQPLQISAVSSEVTPTITMAGMAGDLLVLINATTPTISIADSGTTMLSAEWEAGQYDSLVLWCDGTNWIELSRTNN